MNPISLVGGIAQGGTFAGLTEALQGASAGASVGSAAPIGAGSFLEALGKAANNAIDTMQASESLSISAIKGDAQTRDVVDAVMNAEQTLQAAIAIRDKIVTAFLEVSRMAI